MEDASRVNIGCMIQIPQTSSHPYDGTGGKHTHPQLQIALASCAASNTDDDNHSGARFRVKDPVHYSPKMKTEPNVLPNHFMDKGLEQKQIEGNSLKSVFF